MKFNLYEFIGVMIGDGCLMDYPHLRAYRVEITGNVVEERNYYEKISIFLQKEFNLTPKVFERSYKDGSKGLKLIVNNKKFVYFLKNEYGFTNNKTYTVEIPNHLMTWEKSKHVLRGIFETDGCLYFSKSKVTTNKPTYPRLEITTVSIKLANQIIKILKDFYKNDNFIKILKANSLLSTNDVINSNNCFISICKSKYKNKIIIISAIDNLIKGGAGQAIQNLNMKFNFPIKTALQ